MKIFWGLIYLTLTVNVALGQKTPIQVNYSKDVNNSCRHIALGSGFEKSGMVQYVARPKIIESKWTNGQLIIKIFVVSDCCPPDFLGYSEKSGTLNLYYGDKRNIPNKRSRPKEVSICMCGYNGCCYEFEYVIKGLKPNSNYLVAVSNVYSIGLFKPYPIGYTDNKSKSVHYSMDCDSFDICLGNKIDEAVSHYKRLGSMYDSLTELHKNESEKEKEMVDQIKKVWIEYFNCREAIYDDFIKSKIDQKLYGLKIDQFESQVLTELKYLEPKLDITKEYLNGGAFIEPIKEIKIETDEKEGG